MSTSHAVRTLDAVQQTSAQPEEWPFQKLRGAAKEVFHSLGGGERFLRNERERFHGPGGFLSRIYWESMLFVYWLEDHPRHAARMNQIHERMEERGDRLCTGVFTVGEVLTGLNKKDALEIATQVREAFRSPQIELISFTPETADGDSRYSVHSGY